jgi:alpha-galactosidase
MTVPAATYVTVWRRHGEEPTATLRLPDLRATTAEVLYPAAGRAGAAWNPDSAELTVTLVGAPSAVLLRLA